MFGAFYAFIKASVVQTWQEIMGEREKGEDMQMGNMMQHKVAFKKPNFL